MTNPNFRRDNVNVVYTGAILGLHVLAAFAFVPKYFSWTGLWLCLFLYCLTIWFGIGLGYHRLLTHLSFETKRWFKYVPTLAATLAWQGGPIIWPARHRVHHKYADKQGDPHAPRQWLDRAHVFWVFFRVSGEENKQALDFVPDLLKDKILVFINRFFWVPQIVLTAMLLVVGTVIRDLETAFGWVVWAVGVRTVLGYHATFCVNSVCHLWGYTNYNLGKDYSRNNLFLEIPCAGENNHENHHAQPRAAQHGGVRWHEFDLTYRMIKMLSIFGLAWHIVPRKSPEEMKARCTKS